MNQEIEVTTRVLRERHREGLTLVEIMVVIAILGVLMTVLGGSMLGVLQGSNVEATRLIMSQVDQGLQIYAIKNGGRYPSSSQGLEVAAAFLRDGSVPKDAWGHEFIYLSPGSQGSAPYELISLGRDGQEGGDDVDADLSSLDRGES